MAHVLKKFKELFPQLQKDLFVDNFVLSNQQKHITLLASH